MLSFQLPHQIDPGSSKDQDQNDMNNSDHFVGLHYQLHRRVKVVPLLLRTYCLN